MLGGPSRPLLATKSPVSVPILVGRLAKTAVEPLLLSTGPNRSDEVWGTPTGVVPRRWALACAINQAPPVGLWTLDYGFLTPLDFGLRDFDPPGLWTSGFRPP